MGFETGRQAAIDGISCIDYFSIPDEQVAASGFCSSGDGGEFVDGGNYDWHVRARAYGAEPVKLPGETFTFTGATRSGKSLSGPAIVDAVDIRADVEDANLLYHFYYFSGNGELTVGTTSVTDSGTPSPVAARAIGISIDGVDYSVRNYRLLLLDLNAAYNDTDTQGFTARARGNSRVQFSFDAYFADPAEYPRRGEYKKLAFYTRRDKTKYFSIEYGFIEKSPPTIVPGGNQQGHAVGNAVSIAGRWTQVDSDGNVGFITAPDGEQWWGGSGT
jgi:hypothetical protein